MPKIYEYFGLIFLIRTDDHDPIHVHIQYAGKESKVAELSVKWLGLFFALN
jgi:hypothetical protein